MECARGDACTGCVFFVLFLLGLGILFVLRQRVLVFMGQRVVLFGE